MTPASPAETADVNDRYSVIHARYLNGIILASDQRWLLDKVVQLGESNARLTTALAGVTAKVLKAETAAHVHCGCNLVHKPGQQLADLLRTATEFVDANDDWTREDRVTRLDALRAAVRALQGPPAPFRPQQAHAAPAKGGQ